MYSPPYAYPFSLSSSSSSFLSTSTSFPSFRPTCLLCSPSVLKPSNRWIQLHSLLILLLGCLTSLHQYSLLLTAIVGIDVLRKVSVPATTVDAEAREYAPRCCPSTREQYINN